MRILFAEDDKRIAAFVVKGLREEGHTVEHVADGESALSFALANRDTPFDIVILDVLMPRRDGLSVCRELRTQGGREPVLMLTAMDSLDDRVRGLDSGADDYLVKPFAFSELLARLLALRMGSLNAVTINKLEARELIVHVTTRAARGG